MYTRILFPTDGSDAATAALGYALDVAAAHDATLHVLNVADTTRDSLTRIGDEVVDVLEREGREIVDAAAERARDRGVPVVADVLQGDPGETILEYADAADVDLVVMPTHGRKGLHRVLLGSVTERVCNASDVPVVTVNPAEDRALRYPPRDVLVPLDGSEGSNRALAEGIAVAEATGASLHVLHVVETASLGFDVRSAVGDEKLEQRATEIVEAAVETASSSSVEVLTDTVAYGEPYREILSHVRDHDVDLVAIGAQGQTRFHRYVVGGVTAKIIRTSPAPVLMVRHDDGE